MEDSGVEASGDMYQSILAFAQSSGPEYSVIIQNRVGMLLAFCYASYFYLFIYLFKLLFLG